MFGDDFFSGIAGLANTAYNLYTNKRDFDYQKALQQTMFEREDSAVQRRMADLQAAGLNPNLAAGSAAGAGAVVGRSSTNDVNMGSAIDMISAANQIRLQKQEVQNKQIEQKILDAQANKATFENNVTFYQVLSALGYDVKPQLYLDKDDYMHFTLTHTANTFDNNGNKYTNKPYRNMILDSMNNDYDYQKLSYDLLKKDYDWYTADKISGLAFNLLGLGLPKFSYKIK